MRTSTSAESAPSSDDVEGWRDAIAAERLKSFSLESIAAAFQDLGRRDANVQNSLARFLSEEVLRILRNCVGTNHPNRGEDIIYRVHGQIFAALLRPATADGRNLRKAFIPRILFRIKDAIRAEALLRRVPGAITPPGKKATGKTDDPDGPEDEVDGETLNLADHIYVPDDVEDSEATGAVSRKTRNTPNSESVQVRDEKIDVERILGAIASEKKRLAFRLFMDDIPYYSKREGVHTIAKALGISEKTARDWITEVRQFLETNDDVQRLRDSKAGERA